MKIGSSVRFLTGIYIVIASDIDHVGVHLTLLLDEYKAEFVVCTFREGDDEWANGRFYSHIHGAVRGFRNRARRIGIALPEIGD